MSPNLPDPSETVTADLVLKVEDWRLHLRMTVPSGPASLQDLVPIAQGMANAVVNMAVQEVEEQGKKISCKAGCGACCRQLVPISETEARRIRRLVEGMPEPRRTQIRERFAQARRRLEETGMLQKLLDRGRWSAEGFQKIGLDYFYQGIPCPFLEEESCSIHPDRPISCREYLVTSPAEHCAHPDKETVDTVRIPLKVWTALARFDPVSPSSPFIRWVPLILAPEWAEEHPEETPLRPGPELLQEMIKLLTGKSVPPAPTAPGAMAPIPASE